MNASIFDRSSLFGLLGSVGLALATYLVNKHVIPFLKIGRRQKFAESITVIADEVIADLRAKYPEKEWLSKLDEAIATLASICGIDPQVAKRAINASVARR
ncbi:MAG: hypothetical protein SGI97_07745 [candidate division Zixibacteria bacterium]|nr:hypothetical protein [candidate division Zixibacteria bacterium]